IALINLGHIEQIGTPIEVYTNPANEYVATFLGAANVLAGVVKNRNIEVGAALIPLRENDNFADGQKVKLVFRPEDVVLTKSGDAPRDAACIARGIVELTSFAGAYERVSVRIDLSDAGSCEPEETPYYLTTQTPESQTSKPIIATRTKPDATAVKLQQGDRVAVNLSSFTVLADIPPRGTEGRRQ
ncbi:MAG TPA: hypothetical protein VJS64_17395, partial [Pyrinomonadaceae bacterium]|nr:hypothetical protein [Pyrinomonadaceae bacterium]